MVIILSKPKYKKNKKINTISDFDNSECLFFKVDFGNGYKTMHRSFLISWQYRLLKSFIEKGRVFETEKILYPKPCECCNRRPIRKQLHFKLKPGEDRYKCEHHKDGSLKWTYLICPRCGKRTDAYCYEYQSTELWNKLYYKGDD